MAIDNEARIPVYINDEQAKAALKTLTSEAEKLRQKMVQALQAGDMKGYKEAEKELKKVTNEANNLKKASFDVNRVLENLSSASIKDLRKTLSTLRREQEGLNRDSKEYIAIQQKIERVNAELRGVNSSMTQQQGIMGKLIGSAKGLLPAFSFVAIAAAAKMAFSKIVSATDSIGDKWDQVMGAMTSATNYFWSTLASGNWTNFFSNLTEAARLGSEYASVLDELGDRQRSFSVQEADSKQKILDLEEKVRNQQLSDKERIAAGQERIRLEQELAAERSRIANKAYENEVQNNFKLKDLGAERTKQLLTDLDSQERRDAQAYNEKVKRLNSLKQAQAPSFGSRSGMAVPRVSVDNSEEISRINAELGRTPQNIVDYANSLKQFDKVTDEERERLVKTYVDMKDAQNSAVENTKRVRNMINSLMAGEQSDSEKGANQRVKTEQEAQKKILESLNQAYQERVLKIEQQHITEQTSQTQFEIEKAVAERAYLEQKLAMLEQFGMSSVDVQRKLIERELELIKQSDDTIRQLRENNIAEFDQFVESQLTAEERALNDQVDQSIAFGEKVAATSEDITRSQIEKNQELARSYLDLAAQIGESFGQMLTDQEASFGDFLKNTLVMALDALEKIMILSITESTIKGIAQGPLGILKAAAKIIAIKAAFGAVKGLIANSGRKESNGYSAGGYTGKGGTLQPAGIVHKGEYVIPKHLLENPRIAGVVDMIELARLSGNMAQMNTPVSKYASGGFVNDSTDGLSPDDVRRLTAAIERFTAKKLVVYAETIKKEIDNLDHINKNRNM